MVLKWKDWILCKFSELKTSLPQAPFSLWVHATSPGHLFQSLTWRLKISWVSSCFLLLSDFIWHQFGTTWSQNPLATVGMHYCRCLHQSGPLREPAVSPTTQTTATGSCDNPPQHLAQLLCKFAEFDSLRSALSVPSPATVFLCGMKDAFERCRKYINSS